MNARIDWKAIARARGLEIPAGGLDLVAKRQEALDQLFRPLALSLTPDQEPAIAFRADPEAE